MKDRFEKLRRRFFPTWEESENDFELKKLRETKTGTYLDDDGNPLPDIYTKDGRMTRREVMELLRKENPEKYKKKE